MWKKVLQLYKILQVIIYILLFSYAHKAFAQDLLFSPIEVRQQLNEEKIRNFIQLQDGRIGVFTEGMLNLYDGIGFKTIEIDDDNAAPLISYTGFHHSYLENNRIWFKYRGKINLINVAKERSEDHPLELLSSLGFTGKPTNLFVDEKKNIWVVNDLGKLLCYEQGSKKVITFLNSVSVAGSSDDILYDLVLHKNLLYLIYKSGLIRCFDRAMAKELYKLFIVKDNSDNFTQWQHATAVNNYIYVVRAGKDKGQLVRFDIQTRESVILLQTDSYWLNCFAANDKGDFFMSCSKGLWYFHAGSTVGTFYPELTLIDERKIKTEVSTVLFDYQGGLWAGTLNKGIYYHHPDRSRFQYYSKKYFKFQDDRELQINCFEETIDGKMLIGSNEGLFEAKLPLDRSKTFKTLLPDISCNSLFKDSNNQIWISTSNGLYLLGNDQILKHYTTQFTNYVYETKDKEIYVCTGDGILKWNKSFNSFGFSSLVTSLANVIQITQWNQQLVGISAKGPFLMNFSGTKIIMPLAQSQKKYPMFSQKNHRYTCLLSDSDQDLWVGTYNGLSVWDNKRHKLYQLNTDKGLVNNSIKAIVEDKKDHSFWVTTSRGISHIIKKNKGSGLSFQIENHDKYSGVLEYPFTERSVFKSSNWGLFVGGIDGMNNLQSGVTEDNQYVLNPILSNLKLFGKNVVRGQDYNGNIVLNKTMPETDSIRFNYNQNFFSIGFSGLNYINPTKTYYRYKLQGIDENWRIENTASGIGEANYTNISPGEYIFEVQASSDCINWPGKQKKLLIIITPPIWKTTFAKILYFLMLGLGMWMFFKAIARRNALIQKKQQDYAVERAKSDFITNISHELRTPLTLIITPLKSLISKVENLEIKKDLLRISSNSDLLLDVVNQLLDFKKIDTGEEILHCHFYDNLSFLTELCNAYLPMAAEKGVSLSWTVEEQNIDLYIDRQKITRIVINLLSNAIKFTGSGGIVKLSASINAKGNILTVLVEDSGVGISSAEIDNIFNRFYQADNQNSSAAGSGIGLYMVKYYAEMHGGSVSVESSPGHGTCFRVQLCVQRKTEKTFFESGNEQSRKNILIVEDHSVFKAYLFDELKKHYNVLTADNGIEGLQKAVDHTPDLIITDMMMPEMNGSQLCQSLRTTISTSHIPLIMLTGRASDEARFEGYEAGADAYMVKPFDINLLVLRIKKLLEISFTRREAFSKDKEVTVESLAVNPIDKEFLERAFKCIADNLSNLDYTVEKFSDNMNMDRTGLYRKLIALTDHSPTNFIRAIRLKKAAELLLDKKLTIADISEQVGFNSVSYFTKCFHDAFGKTPSQCRDENALGSS
ncbi:signal transduction histidine kinase/DNA-binding response OmpR family regulator/ligand-binding sensor domain-containing protein [Flavobacterium piscis]|uniref:histidine kinase n=2 Tax=Flavobacterium piscis TaxID=1114874 RepID=A0ABU1YDE5_9FLAO|nr:signal transduction histidine kinase/DNA-binding response OmpR family regulator/ligand-binding sensor domain-containing protein [Flavobacterium piscis]